MLRAAADALGFRGDLVSGVVDAGRRFAASLLPDIEETERRSSADEPPVHDTDLLKALFELPHGMWIHRAALDPVLQAILDSAPDSAVLQTRDKVKRLWRPAVRVTGVLVTASEWRKGLEQAGRFTPDARRAYLLAQSRVGRRPIEESLRFGVGLVLLPSEGDPRVAVPASSRVHGRPSVRHWRFLERVYETWAGGTTGREAQANR